MMDANNYRNRIDGRVWTVFAAEESSFEVGAKMIPLLRVIEISKLALLDSYWSLVAHRKEVMQ
ncbi:hypothetical protein N7448_005720 [Penicillium atrosanguineum]|uniref:Uncharacterized protein n=1 Tax=Penicillium atrosanguineum TaxID=1132637 RepID=A0A9W9H589_9EURO|nr:uncharacterized protein N7443_009458 [Penicillium atrosanguineum]KAJ5126418.1 hypothetical protein N7526_008595 [Penicillium atrosanguineum]KAJ5137166.1 hypothetical protein N7448_005720 [Penicillium atrosanguineum]KAJ5293505.1 hypothetical protein N7443_009458 [Penicillium atrosanguineum]KAJ5302459.1 hypothetical protein N7476_009258 [Penicillium atrosanguineum]